MPADKLENLLFSNKNEELADILERAEAIGALTETLSRALPDGFAGCLSAASIRPGGELLVVARSPAWAARLRFEEACLIAAGRAAGEDVTSLTVRVSHDAAPPDKSQP